MDSKNIVISQSASQYIDWWLSHCEGALIPVMEWADRSIYDGTEIKENLILVAYGEDELPDGCVLSEFEGFGDVLIDSKLSARIGDFEGGSMEITMVKEGAYTILVLRCT